MSNPRWFSLLVAVCVSMLMALGIESLHVDAEDVPTEFPVYLPIVGNPPPPILSRIYFSPSFAPSFLDSEIFAMNPDGSGRTQLTSTKGNNYARDVSPDGHLVLFTSDRSGSADVWVMNSDGTNQRMILGGPKWDNAASFSPDASKVLLESVRNGDIQTFIVNIDGTGLVALPPGVGGIYSRFSPDGTRIAYSWSTGENEGAIFLINMDGSSVVQLTHLLGIEQVPVWSPDGSTIYFNRFIPNPSRGEIWSISVDGSQAKRVLGYGSIKDVSPDGRHLVFQEAGDGNYDLYTMKVDGTDIVNITNSSDWDASGVWGPAPQ